MNFSILCPQTIHLDPNHYYLGKPDLVSLVNVNLQARKVNKCCLCTIVCARTRVWVCVCVCVCV